MFKIEVKTQRDVDQLQKTPHTQNQAHQSRNRSHNQSRSRSPHRSHSNWHSPRRSRSRHRSQGRSHSRHHSQGHSRARTQSHSSSPSPPRFTTKQKEKGWKPQTHLPSPSQTQTTHDPLAYHDRPGPSSLTRPKKTQKKPSETADEERSVEASQPVEKKAEIAYWRYIGKLFAIEQTPWLPGSILAFACRWDSAGPPENDQTRNLITFLDESNIKPDIRVTKTFQSEVCFYLSCCRCLLTTYGIQFLHGIRQLRSELVHSMNKEALEILGIDGPQSDFCEDRIDKKTHTGFISLRENNNFLGTGNKYLCSDQIVRVSRFLCIEYTLTSDM